MSSKTDQESTSTDQLVDDKLINLTPVDIQQEYFENLDSCDWVKYELHNRRHLIKNIAFALFGAPSDTEDLLLISNDEEENNLAGYTSRQKEQVMNVYEQIYDQRKYSKNNEDIVMSILLIVCVRPKPLPFYKLSPSDYWVDLHKRNDVDIWCTAVFRVRKCTPTTSDATCCKVFIDDNARVYQDWQSFLTNNTFPKCVIVAPENGEYKGMLVEGTEEFVVKLTVSPSASLGLSAVVLSSADTMSTMASIGALGVLGASVFTPVGPILLGGAVVATVGSAVYGIVRSSMHLHDRRIHKQSISPLKAEARGSWLNIAGSSIGLGAGAASSLLAKSAAAGTNLTTVGKALTASVEILRHANLLTGSMGVINSIVHFATNYNKHGEKPTKLELLQFSTATLFFFQAAILNRTAQNIIEDAQTKTINEYRASLRSNRHRKIFDKLSAESRRVQGSIQGNTEVIKGIKIISNKDQFFSSVLRINKDVNEHKLRISMTSDGRVNLNQAYKIDPADLTTLSKEGRAELFSTVPSSPVNAPNVPTKLTPQAAGNIYNAEEENKRGDNIFVGIRPEEVLRIGLHLVRVSASGAKSVASLLEDLSQEAHANVMTVVLNLISKLIPEEIAKLRLLSPDEDLITQVVKFMLHYLKNKRPFGSPCAHNDNSLVIVLAEFFQDGLVKQETILILKDRLLRWIDSELERYRKCFPNKEIIICEACNGLRYKY
ncbi:unnamed protein product [Leptidea sinapis]|uniref:DUF4781 domain-containing protein n=1 Tax=Leptidea sinapis TaxID=189913 RepID=A0A5E4QTC1_9NEOP|nr:unnamed protein product [Leptidea sinapis]